MVIRFPDGREELIRSAVLTGIGDSSFRDIVAASQDLTVYSVAFRGQPRLPFTASVGTPVVSLVVPSLLFEDVTLKRPSGGLPALPVVPRP